MLSSIAAAEVAACSDLAVTLPASLARLAAQTGYLVLLPPTLELATFTISLVWHARHQHSPRHTWLRQAMVDAATEAMAAS